MYIGAVGVESSLCVTCGPSVDPNTIHIQRLPHCKLAICGRLTWFRLRLIAC